MDRFHIDTQTARLRDGQGRIFDPDRRLWEDPARPGGLPKPEPLGPRRTLDLLGAVHWLQRESGHPCRAPIAVVGGREASEDALRLAEQVGADLARAGLTVLTGGREGVMEAASRGARRAGGTAIGLLPDEHWSAGNPELSVTIATGIGVARNAIIARAGLAMVAVGGGLGTLSEMALAVQFGRPVFGLCGAPRLEGLQPETEWEAAFAGLLRAVLALDDPALGAAV